MALDIGRITSGASAKSRKVNRIVSHLKGVQNAVHSEGRQIADRADAIFAAHDRPGRHEIVGEEAGIDYLVSIEGPVPHVIEFGREGYTTKDGHQVGPMEGLRILGRAVES